MTADSTVHRVLLVEDDPRTRDRLARVIADHERLELLSAVGTFAEGREALESLSPHVLITDMTVAYKIVHETFTTRDVLNHEIERSVHRLASALKWQVAEPNLKAVVGSGIKDPLAVNVSYKGNACKALPVAFAFQRGTGSVEKKCTQPA